jgi:dTDP-glucose 4,6-dehydratase
MMSEVVDPVNIGNPNEMPKVRQPDITRARTLLGWEPKVPQSEGLPKTLAYFREKLGI